MKTEFANLLAEKYGKKNPPALKAGDTVRVHQKIKEGDKERVQIFEGLVIAVKHGTSLDGTYTVRKIAAGGVGVERTYPLHSPNVLKVERLKSAEVSRAKLYYMRDRLGKAARFKNEQRTPFAWDESGVSTEVIVEPEVGTPEEENAITEEEVIADIEGTVAEPEAEIIAEVPETPETSEEPETTEKPEATEEPEA